MSTCNATRGCHANLPFHGDVARGYEPDSDLPSYGDYVLNPISVSAGV